MSDDQDGCDWVNVSSFYWLARIVPDKGPLNGSVCVYAQLSYAVQHRIVLVSSLLCS